MTIGNTMHHKNNHSSSISPAQAWAILARHARDEIASLRLKELCRDEDRVAALVEVYQSPTALSSSNNNNNNNILIADLSRQRMTDTTLHHLLCLSASMGLKQFIRQVSWGRNDPNTPVFRPNNTNSRSSNEEVEARNHSSASKSQSSKHKQNSPEDEHYPLHHDKVMLPSMHLALRVPPGHDEYAMLDGTTNVLPSIHNTWDRMRSLADAVRSGRRRGATGGILKDVVVIGTANVALQSLQFLYTALRHDQTAAMAREASMATTAESRLRNMLATGLSAAKGGGGGGGGGGHFPRTLRCIASTDPQQLLLALDGLDPASTLVVSWAVTGHEVTATVTRTIKQWLVQGMTPASARIVVPGTNNSSSTSGMSANLHTTAGSSTGAAGTNPSSSAATAAGPPLIDVSAHMILVTGNERIVEAMGSTTGSTSNNYNTASASTTNNNNNNIPTMFVLPAFARCESFLSCSYATILPLSLVFGWDTARRILDGCHDMDQHFVDTNPRHNLPVLLALMDIWNDCMVHASSNTNGSGSVAARIVTPGTAALGGYPQYCAALESHVCGGASPTRTAAASLVVANDDNGLWDRTVQPPAAASHTPNSSSSSNSTTSMNAELVMTLDGQTDFIASRISGSAAQSSNSVHHAAHDQLVCRRLAQADALANSGTTGRPSVLLWTHTLDAFGCGQLLALAEHRALVKAHLWQVDPFVSSIATPTRVVPTRTVEQYTSDLQRLVLQQEEDGEDDDTDRLTLATKTILSHYAGMVRERQQAEIVGGGGA